jgi:hypothetical protein
LLGGKSVSLMMPPLTYSETVTNPHINTYYNTSHQGWVHFLSTVSEKFDYKKTSNYKQNKGPLSDESIYVGFKAYAIMCPRYIQVSFTFAETC